MFTMAKNIRFRPTSEACGRRAACAGRSAALDGETNLGTPTKLPMGEIPDGGACALAAPETDDGLNIGP